jgi:uncharacterized membrane protein HdeD (DUF308 family)
MLDLRVPTGVFFALLGLILVAMGIFAPQEHAALTETNVNLYCGLAMLVFGVLMLGLAQRAKKRAARNGS